MVIATHIILSGRWTFLLQELLDERDARVVVGGAARLVALRPVGVVAVVVFVVFGRRHLLELGRSGLGGTNKTC